jgi:protein TonB
MHLFPSPYKIAPQALEGLGESPESRFSIFVLASALLHLLVLCSCIDWNREAVLPAMARDAVIEVDLVSIPGPEPAASSPAPPIAFAGKKPAREPAPETIGTSAPEPRTALPAPMVEKTPLPAEKPAAQAVTSPPVAAETGTSAETADAPRAASSAMADETAVSEARDAGDGKERPGIARPDSDAPKAFAPVESAASTGTVPPEQRYLDENFYYIKDLITRNLTYPVLARRMKWQGTVVVSFVVSKDGGAGHIRVVAGSGHSILDKNVIAAIEQVQPFPAPPAAAEFTMPIKYTLKP